MSTGKKVVIIGGVACGMKTASRLRRRDPAADITVIEKDEYLSYAACGFPFYVSGMIQDYKNLMDTPLGVVRDAAFFKNVKGVTVLTRTEANKIDRNRKTVTVQDLRTGTADLISYDKLVLATGASPIVPHFEGKDLQGVFTLATMQDALAMKHFMAQHAITNAAIAGGGLIGLETAEALQLQGLRVTIIERLGWLLPGLLDHDMALLLAGYLQTKGIQIYTEESVKRFTGDAQAVLKQVETDRRKLPAELALLSIGVRPNVSLARDAGLEIGETGAIRVNKYLRTSDPDIYAGGDCVENIHRLTGRPVFAPMGSTANKHGRIIADAIAGDAETFPGVLGTAICRLFDYTVGRTGLSEKEACDRGYHVETAIVPGPDKPHFYRGSQPIIIKLVAEKGTGKLMGAQILGVGDVAKRLEIAVSSLGFGATVHQMSKLDLAYAPPFSSALDCMITAANVLKNKLQGIAKGISPLAVKEKLDRGDDFIFLDVRSPREFEQAHVNHPAVKLLPLGKLRAEAMSLPKDKEIIVSCKTSLRAYEAQQILRSQGFSSVKFMDGGFTAWPFGFDGK